MRRHTYFNQHPLLVLGPPRSGTSTMARILQQHFGHRMGREQISEREINPNGVFEDYKLAMACYGFYERQVTLGEWCEEMRDFVDDMSSLGLPWGIKEPRLRQPLLSIVLNTFPSATIIRCVRSKAATVKSMVNALGWKQQRAERYYDLYAVMLDQALLDKHYLRISYPDDSVDDSEIIAQLKSIEIYATC